MRALGYREAVTLWPGDLFLWDNRGVGWIPFIGVGGGRTFDTRPGAFRVFDHVEAEAPGWLCLAGDGARPTAEW
jgi:hypothetical protein